MMATMPNDWKPPKDTADVFAQYKEHYEGERDLKPRMTELADRELKAGATVGQLAKLTGLTPEVFRRRARALGVEHKRPPTVGKLKPEAPESAPSSAPTAPRRRLAPVTPERPRPVQVERTRAEADAEVDRLYDLVRERATEQQWAGLEQLVSRVPEADRKRALLGQAPTNLLSADELAGTAYTDERAASAELPGAERESDR